MVTGTKRQLQNAVTKAIKLGGARRAKWLGGYTYEVAGEHDTYRVYVQGDSWRCTCPASKRDIPCWHLGAIYIRRLGQEMKVRGADYEVAA